MRLEHLIHSVCADFAPRRLLFNQNVAHADLEDYACVMRTSTATTTIRKAYFDIRQNFRILEPQNRVKRNTYFVFAHDFVLALRYLHFFPLLTYMTDSTKYI